MTVRHGTLTVDGDASSLDGPTLVALAAEPGSGVTSSVVSPAANAAAEVELKTPQASRALVEGDERTPNGFERIPTELWIALLVPLLAGLLGVAWRAIQKLRPREKTDAQAE